MELEVLTISIRHGRAVITTSEGALTISGGTIAEAMEKATQYLERVHAARQELKEMTKSS